MVHVFFLAHERVVGNWPSQGKALDICISFLREACSSDSAPAEKKSIMQISFVASLQRKERDMDVKEAVVQLSLQPSFPGALRDAITQRRGQGMGRSGGISRKA